MMTTIINRFSYTLQWLKNINDRKEQCGRCGKIFYVDANRNTDIIYYCSYQCCLNKFAEEYSKTV